MKKQNNFLRNAHLLLMNCCENSDDYLEFINNFIDKFYIKNENELYFTLIHIPPLHHVGVKVV